MRDHMFKAGIALLAAAFIAAPLSVSAGETMNKAEDKIESEEAKSAAAEVTRGIDGVRNVKNDLQVVSASTRAAVTADDNVITRSVESRFSRDPELKKIDVRTDAGVVVLSGQVTNIRTAARASETAHKVDGVKAVKNELRVNQAKVN